MLWTMAPCDRAHVMRPRPFLMMPWAQGTTAWRAGWPQPTPAGPGKARRGTAGGAGEEVRARDDETAAVRHTGERDE